MVVVVVVVVLDLVPTVRCAVRSVTILWVGEHGYETDLGRVSISRYLYQFIFHTLPSKFTCIGIGTVIEWMLFYPSLGGKIDNHYILSRLIICTFDLFWFHPGLVGRNFSTNNKKISIEFSSITIL